tara:strand:+ start:275 stop:937 length:663 start_codon:yes stop_codon:yes gene_type:complete
MSELRVDTITEVTSANGVSIDGVKLKDNAVVVDTISESTSTNGVAIDGLTLKDGNVVPATGKGVDFSAQSDTGTGETASGSVLNDYEQGTFTVTPTTEGTDFTTSSRGGASFYTKIGDWVSIQINHFITSPTGTASSGNFVLTGLPFVCNAGGNSVIGACSFGRTTMPSGYIISAQIYDNESKMRFIATVSGGSTQQLQAEGFEGNITPFGQAFVSYPCD